MRHCSVESELTCPLVWEGKIPVRQEEKERSASDSCTRVSLLGPLQWVTLVQPQSRGGNVSVQVHRCCVVGGRSALVCLMGRSGMSHFASSNLGTLFLFVFAKVYVLFVVSWLFSVVGHQSERSCFDLAGLDFSSGERKYIWALHMVRNYLPELKEKPEWLRLGFPKERLLVKINDNDTFQIKAAVNEHSLFQRLFAMYGHFRGKYLWLMSALL